MIRFTISIIGFLFFSICFGQTEQPFYTLSIRGATLSIPNNQKWIHVDSSDMDQDLLLIHKHDTIFIHSKRYCDYLFAVRAELIEDHRAMLADECNYIYYPFWSKFPEFKYPPDSASHDYSAEASKVMTWNEGWEKDALRSIAIIDTAIATQARYLDHHSYLRNAFVELINYRKSLNDNVKMEGEINGTALELKYDFTFFIEPIITADGEYKLIEPRSECHVGLSITANITEKSTMDLISHLMKFAKLDDK